MTEPLLRVENLCVHFPVRGSVFRRPEFIAAVDDVSFNVTRGETLGLVGESGSGKTTTGLAIARLESASGGKVYLEGQNFFALNSKELRQARSRIQFIFQDPYSALNPRLRAEDIVREPIINLMEKNRLEQDAVIDGLFAAVGLRPEQRRLFPHQFSGGQRQRIGIARALATQPDIIICDEPVSALDVAVQAQILNLLKSLQRDMGLTYVFISHDLGVVQHMCDRVAVMYKGKLVEVAKQADVFSNPQHSYTQALLAAVPRIEMNALGAEFYES